MRILFTLMGLGFLVVFTSSAMALPVQWTLASGGNGHWYDVVLLDPDPYLAWEDARDYANAEGGYLASITSEEENNFISSLLVTDDDPTRYWLGGFQRDDSSGADWEWVNGDAWGYTNWATGEPNNALVNGERQNYLHYWPTTGEWDDMENGRYMAGYILETASIPEPATLLLFGTGLIGLLGSRIRRNN